MDVFDILDLISGFGSRKDRIVAPSEENPLYITLKKREILQRRRIPSSILLVR